MQFQASIPNVERSDGKGPSTGKHRIESLFGERWKDAGCMSTFQVICKSLSSLQARKLLGEAIEKCKIENEIATYLKKKFDEKYGGSWNCIVGKNFGSHLDCIEHVNLYISSISIILFRCHWPNDLRTINFNFSSSKIDFWGSHFTDLLK